MSELAARLKRKQFDVVIAGAGINGAVSAAALAAQGLSVLVIDKKDFAAASSSNSSNLAWGGIKYLESHEYFLVNKLCRSRNHLMRSFPSSVKEIRFLTTLQNGFRFPPVFIYLGTLVYWLFGRFFTKMPRYRSKRKLKSLDGLIDISNVKGGVEYSDAFLIDNDARFVFGFIRRAVDEGAIAENYVSVQSASYENNSWSLELEDVLTHERCRVSAQMFINATGAWVDKLNGSLGVTTEYRHILSKGVHIIVDIEPSAQRVLAFFASDGRLFFVLPMGNKTCIGTTDTHVDHVVSVPSEDDIAFILKNANGMLDLEQPLQKSDVISYRCGVRPLAIKKGERSSDWLQLSRKHHIQIDHHQRHVSVYGGKLTDCVNVGEELVDVACRLRVLKEKRDATWYGEPENSEKQQFLKQASKNWVCSDEFLESIWRRWTDKACDLLPLLGDDRMKEVLIPEVGLIRAEVYLSKRYEKVRTLEDFLRRRFMIALLVRKEELASRKAIKEIANILFEDKADEALLEYFS